MPRIYHFQNDWTALVVFLAAIFTLIGLSEGARKYFQWQPEFSRKLVHVLVGVLLSFAPFILNAAWPALALGILFVGINYFALKNNSFKGMHTTERLTYGTVYFPLAFVFLVWIYWDRNPAIFLTSMLILTFADTIAAVAGEQFTYPKYFTLWSDRKSLPGSIAFFFTALIIVFFLFPYFTSLEAEQIFLPLQSRILLAVITAFIATLAEATSRQGSDNLSLTLAGAFALDLTLHSLTTGTLSSYLGWILFSAWLGYVAYKWRLLNAGGAVGAFILGVFMFGMGGWPFMVPLIAFFLGSNLLSKVAERHHSTQYRINAKGSNRDIVQVYANGGIALIITLIWFLTGDEWLYPIFIASLAAATADTWETEFGSFAKYLPRHILSFKPVQPGFSGGITLIGTLGGALGASVIAWLGFLFKPESLPPLAWLYVAALAGFLASIVDSLLGATVQAKFACTICGKETEKHTHCGSPALLISGFRKMDNDWVNVICAAAGTGFALIFFFSL